MDPPAKTNITETINTIHYCGEAAYTYVEQELASDY
jgi:hypothetical protein